MTNCSSPWSKELIRSQMLCIFSTFKPRWDWKSCHSVSDSHRGKQGHIFFWLLPMMKMSGADTWSSYLTCQVCSFHIRALGVTHIYCLVDQSSQKETECPGDRFLMVAYRLWDWLPDSSWTLIGSICLKCSFALSFTWWRSGWNKTFYL